MARRKPQSLADLRKVGGHWFIYIFFGIHMLMFGLSGFLMAYATDRADIQFLYLHGGIYADLDTQCLKPLEPLRGQDDVVLGWLGNDPTSDQAIPNAIMLSRPHSGRKDATNLESVLMLELLRIRAHWRYGMLLGFRRYCYPLHLTLLP